MRNWNFKHIGFGCAAVVALVAARLGVSLGRLIYSVRTGINVMTDDVLPTWQSLIFGDVFFYIGVIALLGCILCPILARKQTAS